MTDTASDISDLENMFGLTGKRAVVTGSGSGLAEPIAKALAKAGAIVIAAHDDAEQARRVANDIQSEGGDAQAAVCDVTNEASVVTLFAEGEAPDIVVLGAMMHGGVPAVEMGVLVSRGTDRMDRPTAH